MAGDPRILVIDGDVSYLDGPSGRQVARGYEVEAVPTGRAGIDRYRRLAFDVVLTELELPDMDGFDVLEQILEIDPAAEVIVLTDHGSVRLAVDAVKAGAFYFLEKPCDPRRLRMLVATALRRRARGAGIRQDREAVRGAERFGDIIGTSKPMREVFAMIEAVAKSDANILIVGESGTGKELVANAIHARSTRAEHHFVKINCAALPRELIENELFGHARGAFTGATHDKAGLIGTAAGGSLLLDEIGEMPVELQPKLLRVLQERQFTRLGSERTFKADFRLIASTNQPPEAAIRAGRLREDLYYRIATITIVVPPLRERAEDIVLLADHMLRRFSAKYAKPISGYSTAAYAAMCGYAWPGNVRELENAIERAVLLTRGPTVGQEIVSHVASHSAPLLADSVGASIAPLTGLVVASGDFYPSWVAGSELSVPLGMTLADIERNVIIRTLRRLNGNKTAAADSLGIYRPRLYAKIKQYNLTEFEPDVPPSAGARD